MKMQGIATPSIIKYYINMDYRQSRINHKQKKEITDFLLLPQTQETLNKTPTNIRYKVFMELAHEATKIKLSASFCRNILKQNIEKVIIYGDKYRYDYHTPTFFETLKPVPST